MTTVFKKTVIRYATPDGKRCKPDTPGAIRRTEKSKKWYGSVSGKHVPLCHDKAAAKQMLTRLLTHAAMEKVGLTDPFAVHRNVKLTDHLADYHRAWNADGCSPAHADLVKSRVAAILEGCRFRVSADLSASRLAGWLDDRRRAGLSIQTSNHYLTSAKAFVNWMVRDRRTGENPFRHLERGNASTDRRHDRRDLTGEELAALFVTTRAAPVFRRLNGHDRELLYLVAVYTGLRASELASLAPNSFNLTADPPTVTVAAAYSKRRREDVIPLHTELLAVLGPWLADKPAGEPVWPGKWASGKEAGVMLQRDLEAVRTAWIAAASTSGEQSDREKSAFLAYKDDSGRAADFHALRHTFITRLVKGGVNPKDAQALARHSTISLTMDRYAHVGIRDTAAAVNTLPPIPKSDLPQSGQGELRATGTEGGFGCTVVARTGVRAGHAGAPSVKNEGEVADPTTTSESLEMSAKVVSSHQ